MKGAQDGLDGALPNFTAAGGALRRQCPEIEKTRLTSNTIRLTGAREGGKRRVRRPV